LPMGNLFAWWKDTVALQLLYNTDKNVSQSFWL